MNNKNIRFEILKFRINSTKTFVLMEQKPDMFLGAPKQLFVVAAIHRRNMTIPEKELWNKLKEYKSLGFKFRRQHPIYEFVADFYCHAAKLIIEVDGKEHRSSQVNETDKFKSDFLIDHGIRVIRFRNEDIMNNLNEVLKIIRQEVGMPTDDTL